MVGEEIALIDGKAAESIHRAVHAHHGHGKQNRPFRGIGQSQQRSRPAVIVNGCRRCIQVLGEAGELGYIKLLGPFSVGHHMMPQPDVCSSMRSVMSSERWTPITETFATGCLPSA